MNVRKVRGLLERLHEILEAHAHPAAGIVTDILRELHGSSTRRARAVIRRNRDYFFGGMGSLNDVALGELRADVYVWDEPAQSQYRRLMGDLRVAVEPAREARGGGVRNIWGIIAGGLLGSLLCLLVIGSVNNRYRVGGWEISTTSLFTVWAVLVVAFVGALIAAESRDALLKGLRRPSRRRLVLVIAVYGCAMSFWAYLTYLFVRFLLF